MNPKSLLTIFPPRVEEVRAYFNQKGMTEEEAECFFLYYEKKGWRSKRGNIIKSWKVTAYQWIAGVFKEEPWRFLRNIY